LLAGPGAISSSIIAAQAGGAVHVASVIGCIAELAIQTMAEGLIKLLPRLA
jgi:small neutral amino acid transporter SnatA (MarC family)